MGQIHLEQVDQIEILTLQDNFIDLASQDGNETVQRALPLKGMEFANSIKADDPLYRAKRHDANSNGDAGTAPFEYGRHAYDF